jgi:hypothetical protein
MAIDSKHPDYEYLLPDWELIEHVTKGMREVKMRGEVYLPMPSGFSTNTAMYDGYKERAQFPNIFNPSINGMVGVIHRQEAEILMPEPMMPLWESCTKDGLTLEAFHRKISENLFRYGRYGVLTDAPPEGGEFPYFVGYDAIDIINWTEERDLFVLNETNWVRSEYDWVEREKYRALEIVEGRYRVTVKEGADFREFFPQGVRGIPIDRIPFVIANATDLEVKPKEPPLLGMANASLAVYRLDADYRQSLYMTAQETLIIFSPEPDKAPGVVGAGVIVSMPSNEGCDAKYVGISGTGIEATRQAIQDEKENAVSMGTKMFDSGAQAESAEALRLRYGAQTATLSTVALVSAATLEAALRSAADFMGLNREEVIVKPNMRFIDAEMTPSEAEGLVRMWQGNAISYTTLYENLQRGGIASPERNKDEEQALIESENPLPDADVEGAGNLGDLSGSGDDEE